MAHDYFGGVRHPCLTWSAKRSADSFVREFLDLGSRGRSGPRSEAGFYSTARTEGDVAQTVCLLCRRLVIGGRDLEGDALQAASLRNSRLPICATKAAKGMCLMTDSPSTVESK